MSIVDDITSDCVNIMYSQYYKPENKQKIDEIFHGASKKILDQIKPYFLIIAILLIVLTLLNSVQFYYYIRMFMLSSSSDATPTSLINKVFV